VPSLGRGNAEDRLPSFGSGGGHFGVKQQATQLGGAAFE